VDVTQQENMKINCQNLTEHFEEILRCSALQSTEQREIDTVLVPFGLEEKGITVKK